MKEIKNKFKGGFLKKNTLVYLAVFVVIILLLNWLIKSQEASRNKNQVNNFNAYYKELLRQCGLRDKALYNCCFSSVKQMAANNFKLASGLGCEPGFKISTLKCLGSYKWCEMAR